MKLKSLQYLSQCIADRSDFLEAYIHQTAANNLWFPKDNYWKSLDAIRQYMLNPDDIEKWLSYYHLPVNADQQRQVGLVFAGNIPLVGFHDFLMVYLSGHKAEIKLSSKDKYVFPAILKLMSEKDPTILDDFKVVERLSNFEAVMATGSNNTFRYFEKYFEKVPKILRKNRTSVAILTGRETEEDLKLLGRDILSYFGLGCRNVTKVYVPTGYDFKPFIDSIDCMRDVVMNAKYKNNFDYNLSMELLNRTDHISTPFMVIKKAESLFSPISMLHYEEYSSLDELGSELGQKAEDIQCIVGHTSVDSIPLIGFGKTQQPSLFDYADGVDIGQFLVSIA
ncbi:acyl-CoA reductase [Membranihabitans marinus]|uniref:acyl-CoA reductase n=1 Tax=Membranihabitans marinus TaxID=1227546 RepID=UPI001F1D4628|nr:acyl-CoA reductase [Membranihabitans marinus]